MSLHFICNSFYLRYICIVLSRTVVTHFNLPTKLGSFIGTVIVTRFPLNFVLLYCLERINNACFV